MKKVEYLDLADIIWCSYQRRLQDALAINLLVDALAINLLVN